MLLVDEGKGIGLTLSSARYYICILEAQRSYQVEVYSSEAQQLKVVNFLSQVSCDILILALLHTYTFH